MPYKVTPAAEAMVAYTHESFPKMATRLINGRVVPLVWRPHHVDGKQGFVIFQDADEERAFNQDDAVLADTRPEQHSQPNFTYSYRPWETI